MTRPSGAPAVVDPGGPASGPDGWPGGVRAVVPDGRGHIVEVVAADGDRWMLRYDGDGHLVTWVPATGPRISFAYDDGDPVMTTTAAPGTPGPRADGAGRVVEVVDGRGASVVIRRDRGGRPVELSDALAHATRLSYDEAGRLATTVLPTGEVVDHLRDPGGALVAVLVDGATALRRDDADPG
jgi:YD repeat-containing protein